MITLEESKFWRDRWASLEGILEALGKRYDDNRSDFPRRRTLCHLVKSLKEFANEQFNYFLLGFTGGHFEQDQALGPETFSKYPPQYALSTILDQVGFDLEILQRVEEQRRIINAKNANILDRADKLAWKALQPVVGQLIKDNPVPTVLTYFQKSPAIRIIPYAPVALIGVPFTVTNIPRDYLAIPHEIGHFVYRRGELDRKDNNGNPVKDNNGNPIKDPLPEVLEKDVSASPKYVQKWVEEIFADVYGCLIGGPVIALDFQDLQLENKGENFIKDDADHPVPFIRPYVYTHVLEKIAAFPESAPKLNTHWEAKLTKRGDPKMFATDSGGQSNRGAASGKMETVIDKIFDKLSDKLKKDRWSADLAPQEGVEKLYEKFTIAHIDALIQGIQVTELACDKIYAPDNGQKGAIPFDEWVKRIDVDGWNTQGPNGRGG